MAFGLEHYDFVDAPDDQPEARCRGCIEGDAATFCTMDSAQVDGESAVDEHPHVVVAGEVQSFAACVLEPVVHFAGKVKIVSVGSGRLSAHCDPAAAVEWEESTVTELIDPRADAIELQPIDDGDVDAWHVAVPLIEVHSTVGRDGSAGSARVDGFAHGERVGHDASFGSDVPFEVRVSHGQIAAPEVPVHDRYSDECRFHRAKHFAAVTGFDGASCAASVVISSVAVVALFRGEQNTVAALGGAACGVSARRFAAAFEATVAGQRVAVVALFRALNQAIAALNSLARRAWRGAVKAIFEGAGVAATVSAAVVAIVAIFDADAQSVSAAGGAACYARQGAGPAHFHRACGTASVAAGGIAVVALFGTADAPVTAHGSGSARHARLWTDPVGFDALAVAAASVAGLCVAVVACFASFEPAVAAHGRRGENITCCFEDGVGGCVACVGARRVAVVGRRGSCASQHTHEHEKRYE